MIFFALALFCSGGLVFAISAVWTLALAFQRHVAWGLAVLLIPLGNVAFLFVNWREARIPFFIGLASLMLMGSAFTTMPRDSITFPLRSAWAAVQKDRQTQKMVAEQQMLVARQQGELELRLAGLKHQEDLLLQRKAALLPSDQQGAQLLSAEIRQYNADLQPLLAQMQERR